MSSSGNLRGGAVVGGNPSGVRSGGLLAMNPALMNGMVPATAAGPETQPGNYSGLLAICSKQVLSQRLHWHRSC